MRNYENYGNDVVLYAIALDHDDPELPSYWISKVQGDGPGWTVSPSKKGRLKIPKHDAERIMNRLPLVAQLKIERGWEPALVKIGPKRRKRKKKEEENGRQVQAYTSTPRRPRTQPSKCGTPRELLEQVELLRVQAEKLCVEADIDSPEGYWLADTQSILARLSRQGSQLLLGADAPA